MLVGLEHFDSFLCILCISFSKKDSGLCIYHLSRWLNFGLLHNSQWITFPIQSYLLLYSFFASLQHAFMWLTVSSLLHHDLHLLFLSVLSIFALTEIVLMALFYAAIKSDSVSLFKYPLHSNIQVISWAISLVFC